MIKSFFTMPLSTKAYWVGSALVLSLRVINLGRQVSTDHRSHLKEKGDKTKFIMVTYKSCFFDILVVE